MKTKFNLFGDRVLVSKQSPKQGTIILPPMGGHDMHRMGKIVEVGNGKRPGRKDVEMFVKKDELVWFQTNAVMQAALMYECEGELFLNLMQSELIARLDSNEVTFDGFHMLGDWVLVRPFLKEKSGAKILLPEAAKQAMAIYFKIEKMGAGVDIGIKAGDEVILTHGRTTPFQIGNEDFGYVHKNEIHGIVEESRIIS